MRLVERERKMEVAAAGGEGEGEGEGESEGGLREAAQCSLAYFLPRKGEIMYNKI